MARETVHVVDVEMTNLDELDAAKLVVGRVIQHQNLLVQVNLRAHAPTGDAEEAIPIMDGIADALVEDAVAPLVLTTAG